MKVEPSSEIRTWAHMCRQFFEAAIEQGFTEAQAFELTQTVLEKAFNHQGGE